MASFEMADMPSKYRIGLAVSGSKMKEEVIFVANDEDDVSLDFTNQNLEGNDFEFELSRCSTIKLEGDSEDGESVRIKRVSIIPINRLDNSFSMVDDFRIRRVIEVNGTSATISLASYPDGATFFVEPADRDTFLGYRFTISKIGELDSLEQTCVFRKGVPIEGRVVEEGTQQPVRGVNIKWNQTERPNLKHVDGAFPRFDLKTDAAGRFRFSVPDVDGIVGIQGAIKGHMGFCVDPDPSRFPWRIFQAGLWSIYTTGEEWTA